MKRKIIAIGIIAAFASGLLCGCGNGNENQTESADSETVVSASVSEEGSAINETEETIAEPGEEFADDGTAREESVDKEDSSADAYDFHEAVRRSNEDVMDGSAYKEIMERREKQDLATLNFNNLDTTMNLCIYILIDADDNIHDVDTLLAEAKDDFRDIESIINGYIVLEPFYCGDHIFSCSALVDDPAEAIEKAYADERVIFAEPIPVLTVD